MELSRGRGVLVSWQLWSLAIWSHSSLVESCELWVLNWEAEAGVFPRSGLSSKFSVSDVFPHFIPGLRSELILQFRFLQEYWGDGIHLRVGGRGRLGKVARKQRAYVNKNVCEGSSVWLWVLCGTETCMIRVPEVSYSRFILWLHNQNNHKYKLKWRFYVS